MADTIQVVRVRSVYESKDDTAIVVFEAVGGVDSERYHATVRVPVGDVIEVTEERANTDTVPDAGESIYGYMQSIIVKVSDFDSSRRDR